MSTPPTDCYEINSQWLSQETNRVNAMTPDRAELEHMTSAVAFQMRMITNDPLTLEAAAYWLQLQDLLYIRSLEGK